MTIQFNCPNCNAVIAFDSKHIGKRAKCISCGQRFIIPSEDHAKAEKVEPEPELAGEPLPGFYRAALAESWKLFVRSQNATGLVFVIAAVCFKFFTGHTDYSFEMGAFRVIAPVGLVVTLASWGALFWYYMEIIQATAYEVEDLPDVYMGGLFGFIWEVVRSLFLFAIALVAVELPYIAFLMISKSAGIDSKIVEHILALAGLFAFPMAILTVAVGQDVTMVTKPSYILKPIIHAFWPYVLVVTLFVITWELQLRTVGYGDLIGQPASIIALHLLLNIAVQALALISMRSTGLFHRHFACHFPW